MVEYVMIDKKDFKILYVENDQTSILVMERLLQKQGYNFSSAESAEKGIERLKKIKFDIVLLDINLGSGMSGEDFQKFIRTIDGYENTPIFALTTRAFGNEDQRLLDEGFNGYFAKPYDPDNLLKTIEFFRNS